MIGIGIRGATAGYSSALRATACTPDNIYRNARGHDQQPDQAVERLSRELIEHDQRACDREDDGQQRDRAYAECRRVAAAPAGEDEANGEQAEEDPLRVDDAREEAAVCTGHNEHAGPDSLRRDRDVRRPKARMDDAAPLEQQSI